jgi:hypothetical protein
VRYILDAHKAYESRVVATSLTRELLYTFPKQKEIIPEKYDLPLMETTISERMALSRCINQIVMVGDLEIPAPQSIMDYAENQADAGVSASEFEMLAKEILEKMAVM